MKNLLPRTVLLSSIALTSLLAVSCQTTDPQAGATITRSQAETTALAQVQGGSIKSGELETEDAKLIWSFDIAQPGTTDIREIAVDAKTGVILSNVTETAEAEAAEAAADAKMAKHS